MRVRFANLVGSTACKNQTGYESHTQERARTLSIPYINAFWTTFF